MKKPIPVAIITLITIISIGADNAFASTDGVQRRDIRIRPMTSQKCLM